MDPSLSIAVAVRLTEVPSRSALGVIEVILTTGIPLTRIIVAELVTELSSLSVALTVMLC